MAPTELASPAVLAFLPSPTHNVWYLGPFPLRAYAICIIAGIIAAVVITDRRLQARGGPAKAVTDIAVWAVPSGILGARIYHVVTSPEDYFGASGHLVNVLKVWNGGLGIWGAIAGGAVGAWFACRRRGIPLELFADSLAPGLAVAQAIGRFGNWFNNELYGRATDLPWGLVVNEMDPSTGRAVKQLEGAYHPTFLYETLWCLGVAALVWWAGKRFQLDRGRAFALYVMAYVAGRFWIEALRKDEATYFFKGQLNFLGPLFPDGVRLNDFTCVIVFLGALIYFLRRKGPRKPLEAPTVPDTSGEESETGSSETGTSETGTSETGAG
jgi:prolipoprotein diacylglyceryl transferase